MFTNNYIRFREMMFKGQDMSLQDCNGTSFTAHHRYSYGGDIGVSLCNAYCNAMSTAVANSNSGSYCSPGVYFGSGSTPAAKSDYKLESPITSGLTIVNPYIKNRAIPMETEEGKYSYVVAFSLQNTSSETINIYEIGLFGEADYYKSSSSTTHYAVLFNREVLDTPISIAPGEVKVITYKLTFNQTLNVET